MPPGRTAGIKPAACHAVALFVFAPVLAFAAPDEPPLVGQPDGFSGAIGQKFAVAALAEPTDVQVEEPIRFRLQIASMGPAQRPPDRPDLRKMATLSAVFQVRDLISEDRTTDLSGGGRRWDFAYSLRLKDRAARAIPPVRFVYYTPPRTPRAKGYYQTTYTHTIPLTVRTASPANVAAPTIPARIYRIAADGRVLRLDRMEAVPPLWEFVFFFGLPPLLCGVWYLAWCKLYPDAARAARRRRTQAARLAVKLLRAGQGEDPDAQAKRASSALAAYLWQRLDVSLADATPSEAGMRLGRLGLSEPLSDQVADVLRACDATRFGRDACAAKADLPAVTEKLILSLEMESWAVSQS